MAPANQLAGGPVARLPISQMHRGSRNFVAACITLVTTLVVIEVFLQVAIRVSPRLDFVLSLDQGRHVDDEELVWRPHPGHPDHDRNGFRNARVPSQTDVLALGDSQTYGTGVYRNETWIHQLGVLMGVGTYNMAYGGYGPVHSRALLDEGLELHPRVVIEAMYTGNDLYDSYLLVYVNHRFPEYGTRDNAVLTAIENAESDNPGAPELPGLRPLTTIAHVQPHISAMRHFFSQYSKLYGFLRASRRTIGQVMGSEAIDPYLLWSDDWELLRRSAASRPEDFSITEIDTFRTLLTPRYRSRVLDTSDPRVEEGFRISLEAVLEMRDVAESQGIQYLVLLIPTKELVFKDLIAAHGVVPGPLRELFEMEETVLHRTIGFLDEHGIEHIEALPALRNCIKIGRQPYQITQDGHPNAIGHRAIAELVRDALVGGP